MGQGRKNVRGSDGIGVRQQHKQSFSFYLEKKIGWGKKKADHAVSNIFHHHLS